MRRLKLLSLLLLLVLIVAGCSSNKQESVKVTKIKTDISYNVDKINILDKDNHIVEMILSSNEEVATIRVDCKNPSLSGYYCILKPGVGSANSLPRKNSAQLKGEFTIRVSEDVEKEIKKLIYN